MNLKTTWVVLAHTFRDSIRAKWLLLFTVVFFLLAVNIPTLILIGANYLPQNYLSTYLNYIVTLSFPFLPLLALPMGASSIVEERESGVLQYVLSNPLSKMQFLLGRTLGLLFATTVVVILGYGVAAAFTFRLDAARYGAVLEVAGVAVVLNALIVGLALAISVLLRRKATALGVAIFAWFLFTVLSDLGFLAFILNLRSGAASVVPVILLNPVETARILASLLLGGGIANLGVSGEIMVYVLGKSAALVSVLSLLGWIAAAYAVCVFAFRRQDI